MPRPAPLVRALLLPLLLGGATAVRAVAPPEVPLREGDIPVGPAQVELRQNAAGAWRFFVNGEEFPVRGAGGAEEPGLLEHLKAAGGNCVRTWGIESLEKPVTGGERFIDRAYRLGVMVVPGLWLDHERHGFDYADTNFIARQRAKVLASVRRYKDHPAVLAWGLGNEMEGPADATGSAAVLREVEALAKLVKAEDPAHPVMTVIAFTSAKIRPVSELCPSVDVLGANTYGGAAGVGGALKGNGWTRPFIVAEFGVPGFWEVPKTPWGAPFEPTSQEKALTFYSAHRLVFDENDGRELCLGTFAFLWGWKQERTATWFGMFLPTLEKLPMVDAMTKAWTGRWPVNRCPKVLGLTSPAAGRAVQPGVPLTAQLDVVDPEGDPLAYEWVVTSESTARSVGGEAEYVPEDHPELVTDGGGPDCRFTSPPRTGDYRMMVTVRDGRGSAATANFPFRVEP